MPLPSALLATPAMPPPIVEVGLAVPAVVPKPEFVPWVVLTPNPDPPTFWVEPGDANPPLACEEAVVDGVIGLPNMSTFWLLIPRPGGGPPGRGEVSRFRIILAPALGPVGWPT